MSGTTVDIQKITEEIKAEIAEKGLVNDIPSFDEVILYNSTPSCKIDLNLLKRELDYLKRNEIHYYREITSYHKWLAPVVAFVKRVIRKLCKFLGEPAVNEINEYHRHVVKALEYTIRALEQAGNSAEVEPSYAAQLIDVHKYKLLAEQYAAVNYRMGKDLQALQGQLRQLQEDYEQLKLQSERAELKADIAKLRTEKEKRNSGEQQI